MDESKEVQDMQRRVTFSNPEGLSLVGIIHTPPQAKDIGIILCHGFTGSKNRNFIPILADEFALYGYTTLRFDFSGNEESEGKFEDRTYTKYIEDLRMTITYFRKYVSRICIVGHSMGGAIAILEYNRYKDYNACVLLAPGIILQRDFFTMKQKEQLRMSRYLDFTAWGKPYRLKQEYFTDRKRYDLLEEGKKIPLPTLLLIGEKDTVVSIDACKEVAQHNKSIILKIIPEEDHIFHNKTNTMLKHIIPFLASLPLQ